MTSHNVIKFSYNWKLFASGIVFFSAIAFLSRVLPQEHICYPTDLRSHDAWEQIALKLYCNFLIHVASFINKWLYPAVMTLVIAIGIHCTAKLAVWIAQLSGIIIKITNTIVLFLAGDRTITVAAPEFQVNS